MCGATKCIAMGAARSGTKVNCVNCMLCNKEKCAKCDWDGWKDNQICPRGVIRQKTEETLKKARGK
jgi:hypothetical protein